MWKKAGLPCPDYLVENTEDVTDMWKKAGLPWLPDGEFTGDVEEGRAALATWGGI
jgi:hypothetical protein